jgi:hypothetical protein
MKFSKIVLSLTLSSSLLVACGGGGGSRSPDRLGLQLDKDTLRLVFQPSTARTSAGPSGEPRANLPGTGNNSISVQMLGAQTDGVETNLLPELNVTRAATWSLSGVGTPAVATLASSIRDAASLGDVQDILSSVRLMTDDTAIEATVQGIYENKTLIGKVFILPPIPSGLPFISGVNIIPINPAVAGETYSTVYQLLQSLQNSSTPENRTNLVKFCSSSDFAEFSAPQPSTSGVAPVVFSNPFDPAAATPSPVAFDIYTIDPADSCDNIDAPRIATLPVQIVPAQVSSVDICAITNPDGAVCGEDGLLLSQTSLSQCRGLGADLIEVPAAQRLQMVAKVSYLNPANASQPALIRYQCSSANSLAWSADPTAIYSIDLDETDGDATFISRSEYKELDEADTLSTVNGTYTYVNQNGSEIAVEDELVLKLVDAEVGSLSIERIDGMEPAEGENDRITLNALSPSIGYRAMCQFVEFDANTDPVQCPDSAVSWSLSSDTILEAAPESGSATTVVSELEDRASGAEGNVVLTAKYQDGVSNLQAQRTIETVEDELVELHLLQSESGNAPEVDAFSCVGRQDTVGTLQDGTNYAPAQQQFYAYALFQSDVDAGNDTPTTDVTDNPSVIFIAERGYAGDNGSCITSADPTGNLPSPGDADIPGLDQLPDNGETSSFSSENKGELKADGTLRLGTVCVRAFIDSNGDNLLDEDEVTTVQSSTVLALPVVDDDLLTFSSELCGILEPVLTLGAGLGPNGELPAGVVLPLLYGVSLVADPVLAGLDEVVPTDELIIALLSGDFSQLNENFPTSPVGGLGVITNALLGDEGLGPVVDVLDSCVLDPTTAVVTDLLTALLTADPGAFQDPAFQSEECQAVLGDLGGGGDPAENLGPLADLLQTLSEQSPSELQDLLDQLFGFLQP